MENEELELNKITDNMIESILGKTQVQLIKVNAKKALLEQKVMSLLAKIEHLENKLAKE